MGTDLINNEIASIEKSIGDSNSDYWRGPSSGATQARYLQLLEARDGGASPPPVPANERERRDIEKLMGDTSSKYWKGPEAAQLQARYRELIEPAKNQHDASARAGTHPSTGEGGAAPFVKLPPGADAVDVTVMYAANDVLAALPAATRNEFLRGFDALPPDVLKACHAELATQAPWVAPVGSEDVRRFATTVEGQRMVQEWGSEAPMKLARLRGRLVRWMNRMPPDAQNTASHWLDSLTPAEAQALYRVVSA